MMGTETPPTVKKGQTWQTFITGLWKDSPIFSQVLGICSSLAVSNRVENAIAMGAGVTFVLLATAVFISSLRKLIPGRVRMIAYMIIIAAFVIIVDRFLRAFFPPISDAIGPYVGLIITNCILMGRAEAFYIQNTMPQSIVDALGNGLGYTATLMLIAVIREIMGFGTLLGMRVMPLSWENWVVLSMAPGAFFLVSLFQWVMRTVSKKDAEM